MCHGFRLTEWDDLLFLTHFWPFFKLDVVIIATIDTSLKENHLVSSSKLSFFKPNILNTDNLDVQEHQL